MGKGDKRSKKGKINNASYGNARPKLKNKLKYIRKAAAAAEE